MEGGVTVDATTPIPHFTPVTPSIAKWSLGMLSKEQNDEELLVSPRGWGGGVSSNLADKRGQAWTQRL